MPFSTFFSEHRVPVEIAIKHSMLAMFKEEPEEPLRFLGQHLIGQAAQTSSEGPTDLRKVEDDAHRLKDQRIAELEEQVAELRAELEAAAGPTSTPGGSLVDAVTTWRQARSQPVTRDSTAQELNAKFATNGDTITYTYGAVSMFFAGLEGLLGSPSPEVMPTMMLEHASNEPFKAWNSDVERTTTPKAEWTYVTVGMAGTADTSDEAEEINRRQPSHFKDGSGDRKGWKLDDFAEQPQIKKAGLLLPEVAGVRLYTCANPHCTASHALHLLVSNLTLAPTPLRSAAAQCTCITTVRYETTPKSPFSRRSMRSIAASLSCPS